MTERESYYTYRYQGDDLGAVYTKTQTCFKVWAPTARGVELNLYTTGSDLEEGAKLLRTVPMEVNKEGIWSVCLDGDFEGIYYTYGVEINQKKTETQDINGKACGVNGRRSMVVNLANTDPKGWEDDREFGKKRKALADNPVIYETHIKDFSHDSSSGVPEAYRGTYLAFTQKDTTLDNKGEKPTCLNYLKGLGITHVHLLPFFDYGSVDEGGDVKEQFNWGYDPVNYNVPEGSYATDPFHGEVRIRECKEMIQSLHQAGIAVVMDVVYNHTFNTDSPFQHTVPDYYYRMNEDGTFANGSLCGNDTASEHPMYRKFMVDSVCYLAKEYHIDGFRFDLMGLHDVETMNEIRSALNQLPDGESILMYGEPWAGDYSPMEPGAVPAVKEHVDLLEEGIGIFCDNTRDTIKGDVFIAREPGFVNGPQDGEGNLPEDIRHCVCGWCDEHKAGFSPKSPSQIISYVSAHDNFTLWDKLICTMPENARRKIDEMDFAQMFPKILQQNRMAAGIYFTCYGTPFFQAGEEFARTKDGEENSYNLSPMLNRLDWKRAWKQSELVDYYKELIELRKELSCFYGKKEQNPHKVSFHEVEEPGVAAFSIGEGKGDWEQLFVVYNCNQEKKMAVLPEGTWELLSNGVKAVRKREKKKQQVIVNGCAVTILGRRKGV